MTWNNVQPPCNTCVHCAQSSQDHRNHQCSTMPHAAYLHSQVAVLRQLHIIILLLLLLLYYYYYYYYIIIVAVVVVKHDKPKEHNNLIDVILRISQPYYNQFKKKITIIIIIRTPNYIYLKIYQLHCIIASNSSCQQLTYAQHN